MARLVIRNFDEAVKRKLQERARLHGRTVEEEARNILHGAVHEEERLPEPLGKRLRALFKDIGLDEDIPEWRGHPARPAELP